MKINTLIATLLIFMISKTSVAQQPVTGGATPHKSASVITVEGVLKEIVRAMQKDDIQHYLKLVLTQEEITKASNTPTKNAFDSIKVSDVWSKAYKQAQYEHTVLMVTNYLDIHMTGIQSGLNWQKASCIGITIEKPIFQPNVEVPGEKFFRAVVSIRDQSSKDTFELKTTIGLVNGKITKLIQSYVIKVSGNDQYGSQLSTLTIRDSEETETIDNITYVDEHFNGLLGNDTIELTIRYTLTNGQKRYDRFYYRKKTQEDRVPLILATNFHVMVFDDIQKGRWCVSKTDDAFYGYIVSPEGLITHKFKLVK